MQLIEIVNASGGAAAERASEAAQSGGVLASLGLNGQLFVFQLINFAVVALIIWYLILKPLTKKMAERQMIIDDSLENAKKVEENLRKSEQRYQERVDQAKVGANKILEKAIVEAEKNGEEMKAKTKKDIELLIDQAKRNLKIEKQEMISEVRGQTAELVALAVEKILRERLDEKKDKKIIEEALTQLNG